MAPHSGGDQSIFAAYDTIVGVAYIIDFDAGLELELTRFRGHPEA